MTTSQPTANPRVGLWLDQSGATLVRLKNGAEPVVLRMESSVESHDRLPGGHEAGTSTQENSDEKRIERRRLEQLDRYYGRIAGALGNARRVLILGPGEAKLGLERKLRVRKGSTHRRTVIRSADKMTDAELVAVVKRFFSDE